MNEAAIAKMMKSCGISLALARKLVGGGFHTPGQVKDATNEQLKAIDGIGNVQLLAIREVLPKR